jgi:hypothetical protein
MFQCHLCQYPTILPDCAYYSTALQLSIEDWWKLLSRFCLSVWHQFCAWTFLFKNFVCYETVPCSIGCSGFHCWPVIPSNFVTVFCHLYWVRVELVTLPHFLLTFPMKTVVSSIHFIAALIIWCSVCCTLQVTISWFHIVFIRFLLLVTLCIYSV